MSSGYFLMLYSACLLSHISALRPGLCLGLPQDLDIRHVLQLGHELQDTEDHQLDYVDWYGLVSNAFDTLKGVSEVSAEDRSVLARLSRPCSVPGPRGRHGLLVALGDATESWLSD